MAHIPEEFIELQGSIVDGMLAQLEADEDSGRVPDMGYTAQDVDRCAAILADYLAAVLHPSLHGDKAAVMAQVQAVVEAINQLNADTDHNLVEPEQRMQLCELIIAAARQAGVADEEGDITEEWREW